ncbi:hypothetical protein SLEP1_g26294 [Rubroshorea leprosula]|uniref:Beta-catenin-like protein 1 N-terminal domain-containing protein n=1 Tax=Rubroshorea leprosula TaxID=152421 RepID=A0AAV5JPG9_9ROSI|nr:hypothetical protein SLEP1_g26294 [Rubroshorea leprosula]
MKGNGVRKRLEQCLRRKGVVGSGGSISALNTMEVANPKKRKRDNSIALNGDNDLSLLEAIKKSQSTIDVLDICTLKKLVFSFKRRFRKNIKACVKYQNQLEHFADSEVDLHDDLRKLKILAKALELYPRPCQSEHHPFYTQSFVAWVHDEPHAWNRDEPSEPMHLGLPSQI